jgi:hypothetical protein
VGRRISAVTFLGVGLLLVLTVAVTTAATRSGGGGDRQRTAAAPQPVPRPSVSSALAASPQPRRARTRAPHVLGETHTRTRTSTLPFSGPIPVAPTTDVGLLATIGGLWLLASAGAARQRPAVLGARRDAACLDSSSTAARNRCEVGAIDRLRSPGHRSARPGGAATDPTRNDRTAGSDGHHRPGSCASSHSPSSCAQPSTASSHDSPASASAPSETALTHRSGTANSAHAAA